MRKWILVCVLLLVCSSMSFAGDVGIRIDGSELTFTESSGKPFIDENNRVLVPFRLVLEEIGATVQWNSQSRLAVAYKEGTEVIVPIDQTYILKDGQKILNDTYARIVDSRTYLPIRVVMEAFGYTVGWDGVNQEVLIHMDADLVETEKEPETTPEPEPEQTANKIGNSNANLHNGGIIVKEFDTLYYVNFDDDESIYSYNTVTQKSEKLTERAARKLNVVDGVLYFLEESYNTWDAYQMNVDGSSKKQLGSSDVGYIGAFERGVYFYNESEKTLYFWEDGKAYPEDVIEETMEDIQIIGDAIYYVEMDEEDDEIPNKVIRIDLDTLERKTVIEERVGETESCIVMNEAYLFFCNYNDALSLYRVNIDGSNRMKITDDHIYDVNVTDAYVYYLKPFFDEGIVEVAADGDERRKVLNEWHTGDYYDPLISYLDGSLYFRKKTTSTGYSLYRLNLENRKLIKVKEPMDLVED